MMAYIVELTELVYSGYLQVVKLLGLPISPNFWIDNIFGCFIAFVVSRLNVP